MAPLLFVGGAVTGRQPATAGADDRRTTIATLAAFLVLLTPTAALAQNLQPAQDFVDNVISILTGDLGRSIGVLIVIGLGFMAWFGRLRLAFAAAAAIGIVLVFGAAAIFDALRTPV